MTTSSVPMHRSLLGGFSRWLRNFRNASTSYIDRSSGSDLATPQHYRNVCERLATGASGAAPVSPGRDACGAILLYQMLHAAKLNAHDIPADERHALEQGCGACCDKFRCAYELARDRAGVTFDEFCNNADSLRALQAGK